MRFKNTVIAVIGFIFVILLVIYGSYLFPAMAGFMPDTFLTTVFWVGLILVGLNVMVLTPYMMIAGGNVNWIDAGKSFLWFVGGTVASLGVYYIVLPIIEMGASTFNMTTINQLGELFYVLLVVVAMIVLPIYQGIKNMELMR